MRTAKIILTNSTRYDTNYSIQGARDARGSIRNDASGEEENW